MRLVVLALTAIIALAVACEGEPADAPAPAPADTPLSVPTATAEIARAAPAPTPTAAPTPTPTAVPATVAAPVAAPVPSPTPTAAPAPTPAPALNCRAGPDAHTIPRRRRHPPRPRTRPVPTPTANPALASLAPLLFEAVTSYPEELDFVGDGLSAEEKDVLDWADSRLFTNESFLGSTYGPDTWPSDVKLASAQAVPLLMLAIDIEKKADGKHVIDWELDSLDRILDDMGIYEGVCVSCYGKS